MTESFEPVTGTSVTLRPLRPEDRDIESAFVRSLSPETRHDRLLGGGRAITREYIESLVNVDYSRDMALAATAMLDGETLIGVARYVLETNNQSAEFAIVVADAWQGRGIGRRLLAKLIDIARRRGLRRLYGDILGTNRPMLEFVRKLGFKLERHEDATLTRAALDLA
ncbi:MAG TPA: GNAT family N-acetyltransferase [Burkholderiales bacterium]|nr:GNAT family N-acetyltransferase [Burkholderiales bacterium]